MITKEEREETKEYLKNHTEPEWLKDELLRAYDALDEAELSVEAGLNNSKGLSDIISRQKDIIDELVSERDNYKSRAESLEKALTLSHDWRTSSACNSCKFFDDNLDCDCEKECGKDFQAWQFDEARFSTGGDGE